MSGISVGTGLASGLNIEELVNSLISARAAPLKRMQGQIKDLNAVQTGVQTLEAFVLSIKTSVQSLGSESTVNGTTVGNSNEDVLSVTAGENASPANLEFQAVRTAAAHSLLSKGYANSDQQTVGAGTLVIASGGFLSQPTSLDALNAGQGVQRGTIRITDRSGATADVDLSNALTVDEALAAINDADVSVTASADGDRLVVEDTSGGGGTLSVADVSGGTTAADLGLAKSVSADTLTGDAVYSLSGDFTLDLINDGNGIRRIEGGADLRVTLTDDTVLDVNLDGAASLNDVVQAINDHEDNGGKLLAELTNGRLQLTDQSGGGGSSSFTVEDVNGANVVEALGLDTSESGGVLTGERLLAGINSVLLRNLRGGQGIEQPGSISLTDRAGTSDTVDLSTAESLDEVLSAINDAAVQITARLDDRGSGIVLEDTSGSTASDLIVADVGGSTVARDLGIEVSAAEESVSSGSLALRHVNESTSFDDYLGSGASLSQGAFTITDSAGNVSTVDVTTNVKTVGDLVQRINVAEEVSVTAVLNETGDGFEIVDEAGGTGTLAVESVEGTAVEQLGLDAEATTGSDGKQRVGSRSSLVVEVDADDTLDDVVQKINDAGGHVQATVLDDGSSFNSSRLSLTAQRTGSQGRFLVEDGVGLGLSTFSTGRDALLRVGTESTASFLIASQTNTFEDVRTDVDVTIESAGSETVEVTIERDVEGFEKAINSFVKAYNSYVDSAAKLTRFNPETLERGVLNGEGFVLRVSRRLDALTSRRLDGLTGSVDSLVELGVRVTTGGKLTFDAEQFRSVLEESPQDVVDFFLAEESGFAAVAEETLDSLTDPFTGTFQREEDTLTNSVEDLQDRILNLNTLLQGQRDRLLRQFVAMEEAIGQLQSQQNAIGSIAPLTVPPLRTGLF